MARSVNTIFNSILAAKEANADLAVINTSSKTSIYRLWAFITAVAIFTVETLFDLLPAEIQGILSTQKIGRLLWYQAIAKAFQYGDSLQVNENGTVSYATIDATKQVISQCAVTENADGVSIKIATEINGELSPLPTDQQNAFQVYMQKAKIAGIHLFIINQAANKLKIIGTVYFNPLLINPDGTLIADGSRPVDAAVIVFLKNMPFGGVLRRNSLISAILAAEGVTDFQLTSLQYRVNDAGVYADILVSHIPYSGYYKIDELFPLTTALTYQPDVQS